MADDLGILAKLAGAESTPPLPAPIGSRFGRAIGVNGWGARHVDRRRWQGSGRFGSRSRAGSQAPARTTRRCPRSSMPWPRTPRVRRRDQLDHSTTICSTSRFRSRPPAGSASSGWPARSRPFTEQSPTPQRLMLVGAFLALALVAVAMSARGRTRFAIAVFAARHRDRDARRSLGAHAACAATTRSARSREALDLSPTTCIAPCRSLASERDRLAGILETMAEGVLLTDPQRANRARQRLAAHHGGSERAAHRQRAHRGHPQRRARRDHRRR